MSKAPVIYCYPFIDVGNTYINKNVALWRSLGFVVKSCPKDLWHDIQLPRSSKVIVLNWYEDWMLGGTRPRLISLMLAVALLFFFWLTAANIIWVRHNFKPHDLDKPRLTNFILAFFLGRLAKTIVTHRPVSALRSTVVPHSLVLDMVAAGKVRDIEFLCFGVVRKYKALDTLLQAWPVECSLVIMGKSSDQELTNRLNGIIAERQLNVRWENRFIPDDELNDALCRTRCVVLAHEDKSMIVSGAFYHAIACGANILIRAGEFADYNAKVHSFVRTFEMDRLREDIANMEYVAPEDVIKEAKRNYGDEICSQSWAKIFNG